LHATAKGGLHRWVWCAAIGSISVSEERSVAVNTAWRPAQSSFKARRGVRTRVVGEGDLTIEWQRGPLGTWVTLAGEADAMTVYWEADGTITMSPARGRARALVTFGSGERVRRKTFRAFLHVAERALSAARSERSATDDAAAVRSGVSRGPQARRRPLTSSTPEER
jgi:hypothetical protein